MSGSCKLCPVCQKADGKFLCARCGTSYCSRAHQKQDVAAHRAQCHVAAAGAADREWKARLEDADDRCSTSAGYITAAGDRLSQMSPRRGPVASVSDAAAPANSGSQAAASSRKPVLRLQQDDSAEQIEFGTHDELPHCCLRRLCSFLSTLQCLLRLGLCRRHIQDVVDTSANWSKVMLCPRGLTSAEAIERVVRQHGTSSVGAAMLRKSAALSEGQATFVDLRALSCRALLKLASRMRQSMRSSCDPGWFEASTAASGADDRAGLVMKRHVIDDAPVGMAGDADSALRLHLLSWYDPLAGLAFRPPGFSLGLAVSPASGVLYKALNEYPMLAKGQNVLELGSGAGVLGLSCLLRGCRIVICTDVDESCLRVLQVNAALAAEDAAVCCGRQDVAEAAGRPAAVAKLWFGRSHLAAFREECQRLLPEVFQPPLQHEAQAVKDVSGSGASGSALFDTILAADVLYGDQPEETGRQLVDTVAGLLKPQGQCLVGFEERGSFGNLERVLRAAAKSAGMHAETMRVCCSDERASSVKLFKLTVA
eukprot:TRINITY_DN59444_c0_g1_i1.p1 TRINITY_DN59444_c0_g1~~TRINITY_DN59444_c0_g1_i1.p1  ORF type:complete len:539 (+),score=88.91 TRINITY_DN59444_c0_g1_i1:127-1743(+)